MSPTLVMYLCQLQSLVAQMEAMKVDNAQRKAEGYSPAWTSDHFNGLANDMERIASAAGSLAS